VDGLTWQVAAVAAALDKAAVDPLPSITPVVCFVGGDWPVFGAPDSFRGVRIEGPKSLVKALTATAVLDATRVGTITRSLTAALPAR
jgi:hypothetical protein